MAPERDHGGVLIKHQAALSSFLECAAASVVECNPASREERHESSRLPLRLLLEDEAPTSAEVLRLDNGNWMAMNPPRREELQLPFDATSLALPDCDVALLTTPLAAPLRDRFIRAISDNIASVPVVPMPSDAAARGALLAGRRIERGMPHYLDRLEQVSLMVLRDGDVVLEDLVSSDAIVAANKEFVSDPIVGLGWPAGSRMLTFYLRRSGEFRRWQTADVAAPAEQMPVEIQLRQMPAQGRAHVSITSQRWDDLKYRPILLDWAKLETDPRSFNEIAEELRPQPIVPDAGDC